jgi:hypothetical protein
MLKIKLDYDILVLTFLNHPVSCATLYSLLIKMQLTPFTSHKNYIRYSISNTTLKIVFKRSERNRHLNKLWTAQAATVLKAKRNIFGNVEYEKKQCDTNSPALSE